MKILQVNVVYAKGSTGKIVADVDCELKRCGHESLVAYGRGKKVKQNGVYKFCTESEAAFQKACNLLGGLMYGGFTLATFRFIRFIKKAKPDIVHIHCINGYCVNIYWLLNFLALHNIPTLVTHHAEFFYTGNCGYALECLRFSLRPGCRKCPRSKTATGALIVDRSRKAWRKMGDAFLLFGKDKLKFTAVSPWLLERSKLSPLVANRECMVVENGIDTSIFSDMPDKSACRKLIPDCKEMMILHVTASFSNEDGTFKGGDKIVSLAQLMSDVTFVIAASYSNITKPLPENVVLFGRTKDQQELAALYNAADLTIIASKKETFSMIVAESLCCGTPIVGFKAGGPESIAIDEYSEFVEGRDVKDLKSAAERMLSKEFDRKEIAKDAKKKFDRKVMTKKYLDVYKSMLQ